jgi:tetratricopeptide (TPR) repeat protein
MLANRLFVVLLFSLVALGPSEAYATAADPDAQAKQAYARGAELFKNRRYPEAATAFEEGNKLKPHPAFLYNLALTYRALNQPDKAIEYYEGYLRDSPSATDRASVEAAIAEERRKLPQTSVATSEPSQSEGKPFYKKWWFWTGAGVAVVALGVGLGVGLSRSTTAAYREVTWQ